MRKNWKQVEGWLCTMEGIALSNLATGKEVLEIGSYMGKSTMAMALGAKSVLAIDTFKASNNGQDQKRELTTFDNFIDNITGYNNIEYLIGKSQDVLPTIDRMFDLVFIDGLHDHNQLVLEIELCWRLIREDGVFAFHDAHLGGIVNAITKFFDGDKVEHMDLTAWIEKRHGELT